MIAVFLQHSFSLFCSSATVKQTVFQRERYLWFMIYYLKDIESGLNLIFSHRKIWYIVLFAAKIDNKGKLPERKPMTSKEIINEVKLKSNTFKTIKTYHCLEGTIWRTGIHSGCETVDTGRATEPLRYQENFGLKTTLKVKNLCMDCGEYRTCPGDCRK